MVERFIAHPPGDQVPDTWRQFTELQAYLKEVEDRFPGGEEASIAALWGDVSIGTVGTGFTKLTNYAEGGDQGPNLIVDQAAGEISIREPGLYRFTWWILCQQGNSTKEEQLRLYIADVVQRDALSVFDIATDKTNIRYMAGSVLRPIDAAVTLYLELNATAGLGNFGTGSASFEVAQVSGYR